MNPILIHKGDCTIFANVNKFLTFNLETELDLTGWQAKFILGWVEKTIDDINTKSFEIVLGAEDTKQLRLGKQYGTIILTDSNGNIKTVTNTIPFEVTTAVVENEYQEIDLTIPETSGVDIKLRVGMQGGGAVNSVNGMTGDVVIDIPDLTGYVKNTDYATASKGGVIKANPYFGTNVSEGNLTCISLNLTNYKAYAPSSFISKATLENIKDDYVKRGITENTIELSADEKANAKNWLGYAEPTDIMQAIASIPQFKLSIVDELPLAGEKMTLYLVPKEGTNNDVYNEYIWIEQTTSFEHLGTTAVDLTDYVKKTDVADAKSFGVVKVSGLYGVGHNTNVGLFIPPSTTSNIDSRGTSTSNKPLTIDKLDYAVKVGLTTNSIGLTDEEKVSACNWLGTATTVLTTEAGYEALETKDANTLYLIEE